MFFEGNEVMILAPEDLNFKFQGDFLIRAKDVAQIVEYATTDKFVSLVKEKYIYKVKTTDLSNSPKWENRKLN